ncbi:MAG: ABC transporter ATP-binding protein [Bacteroidales bacterium]|jgi:putative ABC transport system ATP-binding protein|nr:ABC transporter ATP-binding protein [Bacteroidales bacterium]
MSSDNKIITAELAGVTKIFSRSGNDVVALNNVTFKTVTGEMVLLLGPSGSGKTTLLTLLAGLQQPTLGDVFIFGKRVQDYRQAELQKIRASRMGFIFQTFCLLDSLRVIDNVTLVMKFAGILPGKAKENAVDCLERFGVGHLKNEFPGKLSQGEKQRVAVARAIAGGASLILADEPTGSLPTEQGMAIIEFLHKSVKSDGISVTIASHDERISKYADRIVHLRDGILS